jgi:hypothetical protein
MHPRPQSAANVDPDESARHQEDGDPEPREQTVVSIVWKSQVLGLAFMQGEELRFAQVADTAPEYRMLQLVKYTLKPDVIIVPVSFEPAPRKWAR